MLKSLFKTDGLVNLATLLKIACTTSENCDNCPFHDQEESDMFHCRIEEPWLWDIENIDTGEDD